MICGEAVIRPRDADLILSVARLRRPVNELSGAPEKERPLEWLEEFIDTGGGLFFSRPRPSIDPLRGAGGGGGGGGICKDIED